MAFKQSSNNKRQQILDTTTIKKATRDQNTVSLVNGERTYTDTGFVITGSVTKNYETFYELMMAGTSGPRLVHPKKTRTYRVIDGAGYAFVVVEGTPTQRPIFPGDEVTIEPGTVFKFSTSSSQPLHLVVTQDAKYSVNMEVLAPSDAFFDSTHIQNKGLDVNTDNVPRYSNKAADLQAAARGYRGDSPDLVPVVDPGMINLRPSMGNFGEDGAG